MHFFAGTDTGKVRKENEDHIFASASPVGPLKNLFLVADGMGGYQGGEYASRYVTERLVQEIQNSRKTNPVSVLNDSIQQVNRGLREEARRNWQYAEMGTTLVAATVEAGTLYIANIGDSRLYVLEDGTTLRQITRDHSWVEEMVADGKLQRDSVTYWENKNIITRAVGIEDTVTADFFETEF